VENFAADRPGGDDILPVVHNLEVVFGQIAWVAKNVRNNLRSRDGVWHLPIWSKNDVLHGVAKHRGSVTVGLAYHHVHRHSDVEVLIIGAQSKLGKIGYDGRVLIGL